MLLRRLLDDEGIESKAFAIEGETREDFFVGETCTGQQYRFILPGPQLHRNEWQSCLCLPAAFQQRLRFGQTEKTQHYNEKPSKMI